MQPTRDDLLAEAQHIRDDPYVSRQERALANILIEYMRLYDEEQRVS